jgi:hypothetical protein
MATYQTPGISMAAIRRPFGSDSRRTVDTVRVRARNWHMVTLEVRNDLRRVVQARGRFNRAMTPHEHRVVARWANTNGLQLSLGSW